MKSLCITLSLLFTASISLSCGKPEGATSGTRAATAPLSFPRELRDAIRDSKAVLVSDLLEKDMRLLNSRDEHGLTPLHWSILQGQNAIAIRLIDLGADVNARSDNGETPLFQASARDVYFQPHPVTLAAVLIEKGADVRVRENSFGATPLHPAATLDIVRLLVEHGADVNARMNDGSTPVKVHLVLPSPENDRIVAFLKSKGGR